MWRYIWVHASNLPHKPLAMSHFSLSPQLVSSMHSGITFAIINKQTNKSKLRIIIIVIMNHLAEIIVKKYIDKVNDQKRS